MRPSLRSINPTLRLKNLFPKENPKVGLLNIGSEEIKGTEIIKKVISIKTNKKDIVDKKRISIILKKISSKSKKNGIDPKITVKIWTAMIKAYIEYEFRNFKNKLFSDDSLLYNRIPLVRLNGEVWEKRALYLQNFRCYQMVLLYCRTKIIL